MWCFSVPSRISALGGLAHRLTKVVVITAGSFPRTLASTETAGIIDGGSRVLFQKFCSSPLGPLPIAPSLGPMASFDRCPTSTCMTYHREPQATSIEEKPHETPIW